MRAEQSVSLTPGQRIAEAAANHFITENAVRHAQREHESLRRCVVLAERRIHATGWQFTCVQRGLPRI